MSLQVSNARLYANRSAMQKAYFETNPAVIEKKNTPAKEESILKKGKIYGKDMPRELYKFFVSSVTESQPPSFSKFARQVGMTLSELEALRKHGEFDRAWRDCIEIRRDYLTDCALTRRYDPSFVKFLLGVEFGVGEDKDEHDKSISVTVRVDDA